MDEAHPHYGGGGRLYSESTDFSVISPPDTHTETSRIMLDHISGHGGSANLTHKINHHNFLSILFLCQILKTRNGILGSELLRTAFSKLGNDEDPLERPIKTADLSPADSDSGGLGWDLKGGLCKEHPRRADAARPGPSL